MALEVRNDRESPAVRALPILAVTLGFTGSAGLIALGLHLFVHANIDPAKVDQPVTDFPIPQIQPNPTQDYLGFRRRQNLALSGYAWVDRDKGLVHIPIARAMELIAAQGDGGYDPPDPATPAPTTGQPPDGAPRATATLPASPYGSRP